MRSLCYLLPFLSFSAYAQEADTTQLKRGYTLFHPVPRELLRDVAPDRPGISQSAHTVDAGHFQLEADFVRLHREDEQQESRRQLMLADVTLKLGLTRTTDVQVRLQSWQRDRVVPNPGNPEPGRTTRGVGDLTLRLKQNLFGNDAPHHHVLALSAYARLPTGQDVGAGRPEYGLAVPYEFDLNGSFDVEAQLEGESRWDRTSAQRELHLNHSLLADWRFGPAHRLEVFAEGAGFWNTTQRTYQATLNVGPAVYVAEAIRLDAGVHVPLTNQPRTREVFAGLSVRI